MTSTSITLNLVGEVANKECILIDDIIDTGMARITQRVFGDFKPLSENMLSPHKKSAHENMFRKITGNLADSFSS